MWRINPYDKYTRKFNKLDSIQRRVEYAVDDIKSRDDPLSAGVRKAGPVEGVYPVWSYEIGTQYRLIYNIAADEINIINLITVGTRKDVFNIFYSHVV